MLGMLIIATSCSDSWLDTTPTGSASKEEVLASTDNIKQAINGICALTTTQHRYYGQGFNGEGTIMSMYGEYPGQDLYTPYFSPGWAPILNGEWTGRTTSIYCSYPWYYYYTIIGNANQILEYVDDALGDENERKFLKAEALTFRAHAYAMLIQFYSDAWKDSSNGSTDGVALRLDTSMGEIPLSTLAQCYGQIYDDLDDAIILFKESGLTRNDVFKGNTNICFPDINMAYATYARAALNRDDYSTALTNAKLAQEGFPLMSVNDYKSGFVTPTSEWIWGYYGDNVETTYFYSFQVIMAYNGYYSASLGECVAGNRVLIESFPSTDIRKGLFLHEETFLDGENYNSVTSATNSEFTVQVPFSRANAYAKANATYTVPTLYYPYASLKFAATGQPGTGCLPFIRTSEMVLIEAEANYYLNNFTDAQDCMNKLNADTDRDPNYDCTSTGTDLLEEIILYRRLELWGEGHSWLDCKRLKRNVVRPSIANGGNYHASVAGTFGTNAAFWKWSIPARETDYNSAID